MPNINSLPVVHTGTNTTYFVVTDSQITKRFSYSDLSAQLAAGIGIIVTGPQGPSGASGPSGAAGCVGPSGPIGPSGLPGFGYGGPSGPTGAQGYQGTQGYQGPTGTQGYQGPSGAQGYQGTQGYQGFQGCSSLITSCLSFNQGYMVMPTATPSCGIQDVVVQYGGSVSGFSTTTVYTQPIVPPFANAMTTVVMSPFYTGQSVAVPVITNMQPTSFSWTFHVVQGTVSPPYLFNWIAIGY